MPVSLHWTNSEVELIVADYFSMLEDELVGESINKTFHRNNLRNILFQRSEGSIEFKHQNISAVLIKLGLPYISGYKPRWNYQQILEEKIISYLQQHQDRLIPKIIQFVDSKIIEIKEMNFDQILDAPPTRRLTFKDPEIEYSRKPIKINYLAREQNNIFTGRMGEKIVIDYEKWRLRTIDKEVLADRVEWISEYDDEAGFDILSKNNNGTDRYIEVKTTKLSKDTPFFFSKNEYEFSLIKNEEYHLYRIFNLGENSRMFKMNGNFDIFCNKEAMLFKGYF